MLIGLLSQTTMILIAPLLFLLIFWFIFKSYNFYKFRTSMKNIPGPLDGEKYTTFLRLALNPEEMFNTVRKLSLENYPIYRISVYTGISVALLDPNDVELVISGTKHMRKSIIYNFLKPWLGNGLLTSSGPHWQSRRKILTPAFHFNILKQFVEVFNEETFNILEQLKVHPKTDVDLVPLCTKFTLQCITETAMGLKSIEECRQAEYKTAVHNFGEIVLQRLTQPLSLIQFLYNLSNLAKRERETVKILHDMSNQIIKEKQKEKEFSKKRLLDILLKAKAEGVDIDYNGIREEVDTFMFGGHDTTTMALAASLWTLAQHRDVQDKILEEINATFAAEAPTYQELQNLKYTDRCLKECLRLYPSVPFITRLAEEDFTTTTGYRILKGTIIHLHIFDMHRNPKIYPDPLKFDPDRFLPENIKTRHPFAYIPFSAGPRNCIGQRFALLEMKAFICGIIRNFVLQPVSNEPLRFKSDLVLRPTNQVKIRLIRRPKDKNE